MRKQMDNNQRRVLLSQLINFEKDPKELIKQLGSFEWDCEFELVTLEKEHLENALDLYLSKKIRNTEIQFWAESLECREDVAVNESQAEVISQSIFWLANPEINYQITPELAKKIKKGIQNNKLD